MFEDIGDMEEDDDDKLKVTEAGSSKGNKDKWFKPTDVVIPKTVLVYAKRDQRSIKQNHVLGI
jgi:hypothetical protein